MSEKIKAIVFDLEGVLIKGIWDSWKKTDCFKDDKVLRKSGALKNFNLLLRGKITESEYLNSIKKLLKKPKKQLREEIRREFKKIVETEKILKKLKKNYKLFLLSNHVREWVKEIKKNHSFFELFEKEYFSFDFKTIKPEKKFFKLFLKEQKLKPSEIVFIDDSMENILKATSLGIKSIHFKNGKQLTLELKRAGVKV
jgi:putative hydrolase of the HAD superfamily